MMDSTPVLGAEAKEAHTCLSALFKRLLRLKRESFNATSLS